MAKCPAARRQKAGLGKQAPAARRRVDPSWRTSALPPTVQGHSWTPTSPANRDITQCRRGEVCRRWQRRHQRMTIVGVIDRKTLWLHRNGKQVLVLGDTRRGEQPVGIRRIGGHRERNAGRQQTHCRRCCRPHSCRCPPRLCRPAGAGSLVSKPGGRSVHRFSTIGEIRGRKLAASRLGSTNAGSGSLIGPELSTGLLSRQARQNLRGLGMAGPRCR